MSKNNSNKSDSEGFSLNPLKAYSAGFRNPKTRLWVIIFTLLYLLSPIDLLPEFPLGAFGIGFMDDGLLLVMFIVEILLGLRGSKKNSD